MLGSCRHSCVHWARCFLDFETRLSYDKDLRHGSVLPYRGCIGALVHRCASHHFFFHVGGIHRSGFIGLLHCAAPRARNKVLLRLSLQRSVISIRICGSLEFLKSPYQKGCGLFLVKIQNSQSPDAIPRRGRETTRLPWHRSERHTSHRVRS